MLSLGASVCNITPFTLKEEARTTNQESQSKLNADIKLQTDKAFESRNAVAKFATALNGLTFAAYQAAGTGTPAKPTHATSDTDEATVSFIANLYTKEDADRQPVLAAIVALARFVSPTGGTFDVLSTAANNATLGSEAAGTFFSNVKDAIQRPLDVVTRAKQNMTQDAIDAEVKRNGESATTKAKTILAALIAKQKALVEPADKDRQESENLTAKLTALNTRATSITDADYTAFQPVPAAPVQPVNGMDTLLAKAQEFWKDSTVARYAVKSVFACVFVMAAYVIYQYIFNFGASLYNAYGSFRA